MVRATNVSNTLTLCYVGYQTLAAGTIGSLITTVGVCAVKLMQSSTMKNAAKFAAPIGCKVGGLLAAGIATSHLIRTSLPFSPHELPRVSTVVTTMITVIYSIAATSNRWDFASSLILSLAYPFLRNPCATSMFPHPSVALPQNWNDWVCFNTSATILDEIDRKLSRAISFELIENCLRINPSYFNSDNSKLVFEAYKSDKPFREVLNLHCPQGKSNSERFKAVYIFCFNQAISDAISDIKYQVSLDQLVELHQPNNTRLRKALMIMGLLRFISCTHLDNEQNIYKFNPEKHFILENSRGKSLSLAAFLPKEEIEILLDKTDIPPRIVEFIGGDNLKYQNLYQALKNRNPLVENFDQFPELNDLCDSI